MWSSRFKGWRCSLCSYKWASVTRHQDIDPSASCGNNKNTFILYILKRVLWSSVNSQHFKLSKTLNNYNIVSLSNTIRQSPHLKCIRDSGKVGFYNRRGPSSRRDWLREMFHFTSARNVRSMRCCATCNLRRRPGFLLKIWTLNLDFIFRISFSNWTLNQHNNILNNWGG